MAAKGTPSLEVATRPITMTPLVVQTTAAATPSQWTAATAAKTATIMAREESGSSKPGSTFRQSCK